jgi:1,4-alpha-glucan branching enzyme
MGSEFAVNDEWNHEQELDWPLLQFEEHRGVQQWVKDLNRLLVDQPALHRLDNDPAGFRWVIGDDATNSIYAYLRLAGDDDPPVLFVANFTPVVREGYRLGVPVDGPWVEVLNSDDARYGGSGVVNGTVEADAISTHGYDQSLEIRVPPLAAAFFVPGT